MVSTEQDFSVYQDLAEFDCDAMKAYSLCLIYLEWAGGSLIDTDYKTNAAYFEGGYKEAFSVAYASCKKTKEVVDLRSRTSDYLDTHLFDSTMANSQLALDKLLVGIPLLASYVGKTGDCITFEECKEFVQSMRSYYRFRNIRESLNLTCWARTHCRDDNVVCTSEESTEDEFGYELVEHFDEEQQEIQSE